MLKPLHSRLNLLNQVTIEYSVHVYWGEVEGSQVVRLYTLKSFRLSTTHMSEQSKKEKDCQKERQPSMDILNDRQLMMSAITKHMKVRRLISTMCVEHCTCPKTSPQDGHGITKAEHNELQNDCLDNEAKMYQLLNTLQTLEVMRLLENEDALLLDMLRKMFYESDYQAYPLAWDRLVQLQVHRDVLITILDEGDCRESETVTRALESRLASTLIEIHNLTNFYSVIHPRHVSSQHSSRRLEVSKLLLSDLSSCTTPMTPWLIETRTCLRYYLTEASERTRDLWLMWFEIEYACQKCLLNGAQAVNSVEAYFGRSPSVHTHGLDINVEAVDRATDRVQLQEAERSTSLRKSIRRECSCNNDAEECPICFNPLPPSVHSEQCSLVSRASTSPSTASEVSLRVELECKHVICRDCLVQHVTVNNSPQCPLCRGTISPSTLEPFKSLIDLASRERSKMDETVKMVAEYAMMIISSYISLHPRSHVTCISLPGSVKTTVNDMVRRELLSNTFTEYNFMDHFKPKTRLYNSFIDVAKQFMENLKTMLPVELLTTHFPLFSVSPNDR